jgi:predicted metal-dependent peptidase
MNMKEEHKDLQRLLDKAKIEMMNDNRSVFFTTIVFSLKFKWDDTQPTAYTNGYVMGFNPDFFLSLSPDERVGVMIHEAAHVAYDHIGRRNGRDPQWWNIAADHVINLYLKSVGIKIPSFGLADPQYADMSTEQVYELLDKSSPPEGQNFMEDLKPDMQDGDGNPVTAEQHRRHVEDMIIRASVQQKVQNSSAGALPGEIEVFLKKLLKPKLPWQTILRREVQELAKINYTWARPNRRFYPDHYLPSLGGTAITSLVFYIDISGSVTDHQFQIYVSEIASTLKMFNLKSLRVVQFDTRIRHDDKVRNLQELMKIQFTGRGGTDPECIFEDMEKTKPQLALVFTDGEFYWRREPLKQRLLWLINDNPGFTPLFGRALHFQTNESDT